MDPVPVPSYVVVHMIHTPHVLIAIDPGKHSGLALLLDGVLRYAETVTSEFPTQIGPKINAVRRALTFIDDVTPDHKLTFVTEAQFLKGGPVRFKSVSQIVRSATCWEVLARVQGWSIAHPVWPSTWQKLWKMTGKSPQLKEQSVSLVCGMYPRPRPVAGKLTDNISDAILIGLYYLSTHSFLPAEELAIAYGNG